MFLGTFFKLAFPWGKNCLKAFIMYHTLHWASRIERCPRISLFKHFNLLLSLIIIHGTYMGIIVILCKNQNLCPRLFHNDGLLISSSPCFSCHILCHSKHSSTYYKFYLLEKLNSSLLICFCCLAHFASVPF